MNIARRSEDVADLLALARKQGIEIFFRNASEEYGNITENPYVKLTTMIAVLMNTTAGVLESAQDFIKREDFNLHRFMLGLMDYDGIYTTVMDAIQAKNDLSRKLFYAFVVKCCSDIEDVAIIEKDKIPITVYQKVAMVKPQEFLHWAKNYGYIIPPELLKEDVKCAEGGSAPEKTKIIATLAVCNCLLGNIRSHLDGAKKIGCSEFCALVKEAMMADGSVGDFQITTARRFFASGIPHEFKRGRGQKPKSI